MKLPRLPKWPRGLKARVRRKEKLAERKKEIAKRKAEIKAAYAKVKTK